MSTLQIKSHEYSSHFSFIILFVEILSLYAINLDGMILLADSSFTIFAMLNE